VLRYLIFLSIFVIKIFIPFDVCYKAVCSVVKLGRGVWCRRVTCEYTVAMILSYVSITSCSKCILSSMHTQIVVNNFDNFKWSFYDSFNGAKTFIKQIKQKNRI
jgi:hypothetical protein